MNTFKKLYKQFFGLTEQTVKQNPNDIEIAASVAKDPTALKAAQKAAKDAGGNIRITANESEIEEAKLVNNITDYRGGVEFVLRDPATAQAVVDEIQQWTAKKGITLVTKKISKSGNVVYMYFRLGQDPSSEAQKIQGYLAQMPELKHFRFNVRQPKKKIQPQI
jgi:soluble cytochrome b562